MIYKVSLQNMKYNIGECKRILSKTKNLTSLDLLTSSVHLHFTFMHLADAFIQSNLHCIQVKVSTFLSALAFPGNRTHDLGVASTMLYYLSYRKA